MGHNKDRDDDMDYDTSWDWIMPVVEKINSMDSYTCINIDHNDVFLHIRNKKMIAFSNIEEGSKIAAVFSAVVEFIKYYNEKVKTQNIVPR